MKVLDLQNVQLASINAKYGVSKHTGRLFLTPAYRNVKQLVSMSCKKVEIMPPYSVSISLAIYSDIDNCVKPILDGLKDAGVITDDKHILALHVYKTTVKRGAPSDLAVYVEPYGGE